MALTLNEYRTKLINHILYAKSQKEVARFIDAATKALKQNGVNGHIISRFVDKIISELEMFSPMDENAQHWSNIRIAKILFNRFKTQLNAKV